MFERYSRIWARRAILQTLVRRDLRVRYARSWLGYLWTIIDPLAMALIYFLVFAVIFKRPDAGHKPYFLFLIIGLLPWQWFNASINETARALVAEAKLVRSTNLPRELWVIRAVIAKGIEFLLSLPVLLAFVIFYVIKGDTTLNWRIVLFPVALVLQFILLTGIGLLLAPATVLADDTIRLVRIVLRMLFYGTPIIYTLDKAPDWLQTVLWFNPLSGILELYRAGFFPERIQLAPLLIGASMSVGFLVWGSLSFARMERAVLKEI
ncbi:ABC transporter permease [Terrabacter sp. Ter38]|uniref:ABC transporter permease n=1 Tax=Terrabacter sp. Ter38 TaxID=2926030 RepID=UPI0021180D01|nr:ABC transporter permease [Terrabacter sp. Ter38]